MIGQYSYTDDTTSDYRNKNIEDWYGEDCLQWASDAEKELNIPLSSWVSIDGFYKVTGRDLLRFSSKDFKRIVNDEFGPLFYKLFKRLIKQRRGVKESISHFERDLRLDFNENTTWTVPQIDIPEYDMALNETGSQFGNASLPPLSFEDSLASSSNCLSPSYGSSSLSYGDSSPFRSLSPTYASPSPTFIGAQPSFGNLSPLPPESKDQFNSSNNASTYFTQTSILSGGSLSYGACGGSFENYDDLQNPGPLTPSPNSGSYSSLLPDFNSLMIGDKERKSPSGNLDLNELDLTFREETFSDLDHYIHSDDFNTSTEFDKLQESQRSFINSEKESSLLPLDQGSLEDCMLKKITTGKRGNRVRHPQSWEFLVRLLMNPKTNPSLIKWEDKKNGIFRLVQKEEIAKLWGKRSQKHKDEPLAYDNFARILRYHYKSKVLLPVSDKHLVYKLGDKVLEDLISQGLLQI